MTTSLHRGVWSNLALAALGICFAPGAVVAQTSPVGSTPDSVYFGVLFNGQPIELSTVDPHDEVLVDRGCVQPSNTCHVGVRPSVHAPIGPDCLGPETFVSTDTVTYYVSNTIGGGPKANCNINITISPIISNNGGHCHGDATRPVGTPVAGTYSGNTGFDGLQFKVVHVWPQVSGRILVQAVNISDLPCSPLSTFNENFFICVRGPNENAANAGLIQLAEGPGYELVGGPDNVTRHPDHHYGTPNTVLALQLLATVWRIGAPGRPTLQFNDISLRSGGVFDIGGTDWTPPHCGHRSGRTVDIRFVPKEYRTDPSLPTYVRHGPSGSLV